MKAPYDLMWNGQFYAAGTVIKDPDKKLVAALDAKPTPEVTEDDEPVTFAADEPAAKGKAK